MALLLLVNWWSWQLIKVSPVLGIVTILLWLVVAVGCLVNMKWSKRWFIVLVLIQVINTHKIPLTALDATDYQIRAERMAAYQVRLNSNQTGLNKLGYYLEMSKPAVVIGNLRKRNLHLLDINDYFFAGHPREQQTRSEFEKFSYILLPFVLVGLVSQGLSGNLWQLLIMSMGGGLVVSMWGELGSMGNIILAPWLIAAGVEGISRSSQEIGDRFKIPGVIGFYLVLGFLWVLTMIQTYHG